MMDLFIMGIYVVIGYGLSRLMNVVHTQFGRDCRNNFMTIAFWPIIMFIIAFNQALVEFPSSDGPTKDNSSATL